MPARVPSPVAAESPGVPAAGLAGVTELPCPVLPAAGEGWAEDPAAPDAPLLPEAPAAPVPAPPAAEPPLEPPDAPPLVCAEALLIPSNRTIAQSLIRFFFMYHSLVV